MYNSAHLNSNVCDRWKILTISIRPGVYPSSRISFPPYQNANAYDANITKKKNPIQAPMITPFRIPNLLASTRFLSYLKCKNNKECENVSVWTNRVTCQWLMEAIRDVQLQTFWRPRPSASWQESDNKHLHLHISVFLWIHLVRCPHGR